MSVTTSDTVLDDSSLTIRPDAVAVGLSLPWYRSVWLSSVSDIEITLDEKPIPGADLRVEYGGRVFSVAELGEQWDTLWFIQDKLVALVPIPSGPADAPATYDVEATVELRLPYMQIRPGVYVTNRATTHKTLVAS